MILRTWCFGASLERTSVHLSIAARSALHLFISKMFAELVDLAL